MTGLKAAIVSGAGGFLGGALVARLEASGIRALAPSRAELDWRNEAAVKRFFEAANATTLYHLASSGVLNPDADDPAIFTDEMAMASAIAASAPGAMRIIYAGSMAEYGNGGRLSENEPVAPRNLYARAKVEAGRKLASEVRTKVVHARLFGLYGPGESPRRLLPAITASLLEGRELALSDGLQRRDFVHVEDAARALVELGERTDCPDSINIGTGFALEVRAVAIGLARKLGADPALLKFGARARSPHDQDVLEADTTLLRATLGWVPPQRLASISSMQGAG